MRAFIGFMLTFVFSGAVSAATDAEAALLRKLLTADDRGAIAAAADAALQLTRSADASVRAQAWYFVGVACLDLKDPKRAREVWQDATVTTAVESPTYGRLHLRLGRLLMRTQFPQLLRDF